MLFRFSKVQKYLLGLGVTLIVLSFSLNSLNALWSKAFETESIVWNQLTLAVDTNAILISKMDESTLVARSRSGGDARLTLFFREDDDASPKTLVKDLCARDSCEYAPLGNTKLNGAIADYRIGVPVQIVLMHPGSGGIWLEYKGPGEQFSTFGPLIDAIADQIAY